MNMTEPKAVNEAALNGVEAKLQAGARVADVACGHGASTIVMAKDYPQSTFVGYDYHEASIEAARERALAAGVADRVCFETATAATVLGSIALATGHMRRLDGGILTVTAATPCSDFNEKSHE